MYGFICIMAVVVQVFLATSIASAAEKDWRIFGVQGTAKLISASGAITPLTLEKNLLQPLSQGSRIKVEGRGKVVVVSIKSRLAFEILDESEALLEADQARVLKGKVIPRKGYALPKGNEGRMGGIVMRGAGNTRSCLKAVSPLNTAILELDPVLVWTNDCEVLKQVTITVLADDKTINTAETSDTKYRIPAGILKPGNRYMWLIDGGSNFDMASGVFSIPAEPVLSEMLLKLNRKKTADIDDLVERIAFIYLLNEHGVIDTARDESALLRKLYPGSEGLKELP